MEYGHVYVHCMNNLCGTDGKLNGVIQIITDEALDLDAE